MRKTPEALVLRRVRQALQEDCRTRIHQVHVGEFVLLPAEAARRPTSQCAMCRVMGRACLPSLGATGSPAHTLLSKEVCAIRGTHILYWHRLAPCHHSCCQRSGTSTLLLSLCSAVRRVRTSGARHVPAGSGLGYVPASLLLELAQEAEGPPELAARAQLEGNLLQLMRGPASALLAAFASGPGLTHVTLACLRMGPPVEVRQWSQVAEQASWQPAACRTPQARDLRWSQLLHS